MKRQKILVAGAGLQPSANATRVRERCQWLFGYPVGRVPLPA